MLAGVQRDMGIGSVRGVSLAEARRRVAEYRSLRSQGIDPIEARGKHRGDAKLLADRSMSFKQCAEAYIKDHQPAWRNEKHAAQWTSTLERYVYGVFGDLPKQGGPPSLVTTGALLRRYYSKSSAFGVAIDRNCGRLMSQMAPSAGIPT